MFIVYLKIVIVIIIFMKENLQQYWEFKNKQLKNSEVIDICL